MPKCKHNCFECPYDDCIVNDITSDERKEMKERDKKFTDYGSVIKARPQKANHRKKFYHY